jgi:hypothetical protein
MGRTRWIEGDENRQLFWRAMVLRVPEVRNTVYDRVFPVFRSVYRSVGWNPYDTDRYRIVERIEHPSGAFDSIFDPPFLMLWANVAYASGNHYPELLPLKRTATAWARLFGLTNRENGPKLSPTRWIMDSICSAFNVWEFGLTPQTFKPPPVWRPRNIDFTLSLLTCTGKSPGENAAAHRNALDLFDEGIRSWIIGHEAGVREIQRKDGSVPVPEKRNPDHYEWAAFYQARKLAPATIASFYPYLVSERAIRKAVHPTLRSVGITPRPPRRGLRPL